MQKVSFENINMLVSFRADSAFVSRAGEGGVGFCVSSLMVWFHVHSFDDVVECTEQRISRTRRPEILGPVLPPFISNAIFQLT